MLFYAGVELAMGLGGLQLHREKLEPRSRVSQKKGYLSIAGHAGRHLKANQRLMEKYDALQWLTFHRERIYRVRREGLR